MPETPENLENYTRQSEYSDPGKHLALLDTLPTDVDELTAVVRNVLVHYHTDGMEFSEDRLAEIDSRWLSAILETDQRRFSAPLDVPRPQEERTVVCCRDYSLLTVAALRHRGIPARNRVGFAGYLESGFHSDHVITEYWDGERWVWTDPQLAMPSVTKDQFTTAAQAWTSYRNGEIDPDLYGVGPSLPLRGAWFIRIYVIGELAHRQCDELLLWDVWGAMPKTLDGDLEHLEHLELIDEVAALLLAADDGDASAELKLTELYNSDARLNPGGSVLCLSPTGNVTTIDLASRAVVNV
jgi:hypothetical protein